MLELAADHVNFSIRVAINLYYVRMVQQAPLLEGLNSLWMSQVLLIRTSLHHNHTLVADLVHDVNMTKVGVMLGAL